MLSMQEQLSARGSRTQKAKLKRELAEQLRRKDREALAALRSAIQRAALQRREAMAAAVAACRAARVQLKAKHAAARARAREELNRAIMAERQAARAKCTACKVEARRAGLSGVERARRELEAEREYQRQIRAADTRLRKRDVGRSSAKERRAESDDEVRRNLPAELVRVFDAVRSRMRGSARRSRTETFLQWAEENPGEVYAIQQAHADREVRELVKRERKLSGTVRKAGRYKRSPEALARDLEAVPF